MTILIIAKPIEIKSYDVRHKGRYSIETDTYCGHNSVCVVEPLPSNTIKSITASLICKFYISVKIVRKYHTKTIDGISCIRL